jgi:hypothetical protein
LSQTLIVTEPVSSIILESVAGALNAHPGLAQERGVERTRDIRAAVDAFDPENASDLMLAGQSLLFNALIAEATRDVFSGATGTGKLRALATINGLNRSLHQNLDGFVRRAEAARAAAAMMPAAPPAAVRAAPAPTGEEPPPEVEAAPAFVVRMPEEPPAEVEAAAMVMPVDQPAEVKAEPSAAEDSWLEEPAITWVIETPAEQMARLLREQTAAKERAARPPVPEAKSALIQSGEAALPQEPVSKEERARLSPVAAALIMGLTPDQPPNSWENT